VNSFKKYNNIRIFMREMKLWQVFLIVVSIVLNRCIIVYMIYMADN